VETNDTFNEYYCVFKGQVDTIEAHGGNPGYHGALYQEHYETLTKSIGYDTKAKLDAVGDAEFKKLKAEALMSSAGAYLGYLFVMMANEK
jgi:hypothetical protein